MVRRAGMSMRIAYLTEWFEPEPNIIKGTSFVAALQAAGHEVTVITGFPNYPLGRIYPGYRLRLFCHEEVGGVRIVRLPLYPSHDGSAVRRSLTFLSFFLSALIYLVLRRSRFDLAYVYHPPITVGLAAALARLPFVLDVQDLWPDTVVATDLRGASRLTRPLAACCRFVYERALAICAQSDGIERALVERGVHDDKITVIRNWADAEFQDIPQASVKRRAFTLVYGGNLGRAQQLGHLVDAAAILLAQRPNIRIELFGSGVDEIELREKAERKKLTNVRFHGRIPADEMLRAFADADALLMHLGPDPLFSITIPSKTQQYLALGRPIVAAVNGEAGQLLRASGAAIVVPPADPPALARAIAQMADISEARRAIMGQAGAQFYGEHFSFAHGIGRTLALLDEAYEQVAIRTHRRGRTPAAGAPHFHRLSVEPSP
jgi:glycosyltransferase involved in cell wall biosynthesis